MYLSLSIQKQHQKFCQTAGWCGQYWCESNTQWTQQEAKEATLKCPLEQVAFAKIWESICWFQFKLFGKVQVDTWQWEEGAELRLLISDSMEWWGDVKYYMWLAEWKLELMEKWGWLLFKELHVEGWDLRAQILREWLFQLQCSWWCGTDSNDSFVWPVQTTVTGIVGRCRVSRTGFIDQSTIRERLSENDYSNYSVHGGVEKIVTILLYDLSRI